MKVQFVLLLLALNSLSFSDASAVCGDPTSPNDIAVATQEIVNRLMGARRPDWGWGRRTETTIILALQVSAPELFFGRNKTVKTIENYIKNSFHQLSLHEKGYYITAAKALCMNPHNVSGVNMVESIKEEISKEFRNENEIYSNECHGKEDGHGSDDGHVTDDGHGHVTDDGHSHVTLSHELGALCVAGDAIEEWVIKKILSIQNKDGSFGKTDHMHETLAMLESMQCVVDAPQGLNVAKLKQSIRKMRSYVVRALKVPTAREWLMKMPAMSSLTMIALWKTRKHNENPNKRWSCSEITNVLGILPLPEESEFGLISRLMRLHGVTFLDIGRVGYQCIAHDQIVPVPEHYSPTCNHDVPKTCEPKKN